MSWIRLFYPKPQFDLKRWPPWFRPVHQRALALAYYVSQTIALVGLSVVYLLLFVPLALLFAISGRDPLEKRMNGERKSFWKKSEPVSSIDFQRMF